MTGHVVFKEYNFSFMGDLGHLHYRLRDLGLSQRQVVLIFYGISILLGLMALVLHSGRQKLFVLVAVGTLITASLVLLERLPFRPSPPAEPN